METRKDNKKFWGRGDQDKWNHSMSIICDLRDTKEIIRNLGANQENARGLSIVEKREGNWIWKINLRFTIKN